MQLAGRTDRPFHGLRRIGYIPSDTPTECVYAEESCVMLVLWMSLAALSAEPVRIETRYEEAFQSAKAGQRMLLLDLGTGFELDRLDAADLTDFVVCQVGADAAMEVDGKETRLLDHPAFKDLEGRPGLAIVDLKNPEYPAAVVSVLPERHVTLEHVRALLDLPAGTLTQRTLVWAMKVHPDRPRSVEGTPAPELVAHAERHSTAQSTSSRQYHDLPLDIADKEIVAESWPWNRNVVDAAIDIVHSWRQSSGHWSAAMHPYRHYGYDMKQNGTKWYATGVLR